MTALCRILICALLCLSIGIRGAHLYAQGSVDTLALSADYPFVNLDANHIKLNGADWSEFIKALENSDNRLVNIVHIGDSHIQADIATTTVRRRLQDVFGSAGRGLLVPHRMTGSNEPIDYSIKTRSRFDSSRLVGRGDKTNVGFTGVGLTTIQNKFDLELSSNEPFERIRVFYKGSALTLYSAESENMPLPVSSMSEDPGCIVADLPFACDKVILNFSALGPVTIYGAEIISDIVGIAYHTIGVNGASFASYLNVSDFGERIATLQPDMIVLSLGTNDAIGRFSADVFKSNLSALYDEISTHNPRVPVLLLTPSEIQQRVRRRGKKRGSYTVCGNISTVAGLIKDFAAENALAVYDWYEVSGGNGSSAKWLKNGLLSRDRVHDTSTGYQLAGELFSNAILEIANPAVAEDVIIFDEEKEE